MLRSGRLLEKSVKLAPVTNADSGSERSVFKLEAGRERQTDMTCSVRPVRLAPRVSETAMAFMSSNAKEKVHLWER